MNRKYFLFGLFMVVLYGFWYLYQPYLTQIFVASLLALATTSLNVLLEKKIKIKVLSVTVLTILLSVLFFVPLVYSLLSMKDISNFVNEDTIKKVIAIKNGFELPDFLGIFKPHIKEFIDSINASEIAQDIIGYISGIVKQSAGFFKDMILVLVFYFFVNLYGKELVRYIKSVLPFDKNSTFFLEISNVMSVVFYSILITAILEGALFAVIMIGYGYDGLLFGILYGFASLIPVIGGLVMWLPISIYEYSSGHIIASFVISIYSIVVISGIADTIIKPIIIKYMSNKMIGNRTKIHEIIIFFSIIAGLSTFGFWGMIIGPAITTFFISFLNIYKVLLEEEKNIEVYEKRNGKYLY
jgi:predicted PurR-regulated permease PerM